MELLDPPTIIRKNSQYYYQETEYPKIYKNSYWGSHQSPQERLTDEIIQNRNDFIKQFKIKKYKTPTIAQWHKYEQEFQHQEIDHKEYYEDIYGRLICVCSQHDPCSSYIHMKPIYHSNQWSGYKIIETKKSKNVFNKAYTFETKLEPKTTTHAGTPDI